MKRKMGILWLFLVLASNLTWTIAYRNLWYRMAEAEGHLDEAEHYIQSLPKAETNTGTPSTSGTITDSTLPNGTVGTPYRSGTYINCIFDNDGKAHEWVIVSFSAAGQCHALDKGYKGYQVIGLLATDVKAGDNGVVQTWGGQ